MNKNWRFYYHSLLVYFESQALADRIALPCTLTRGEYNRAWNEVMLPETPEQVRDLTIFFSFEYNSDEVAQQFAKIINIHTGFIFVNVILALISWVHQPQIVNCIGTVSLISYEPSKLIGVFLKILNDLTVGILQ